MDDCRIPVSHVTARIHNAEDGVNDLRNVDLWEVSIANKLQISVRMLSLCISTLGTESGTQFVEKRYKTLHNVESAASQGPKPLRRKC